MYKVVINDYKTQWKSRLREMYDAGECFFIFTFYFYFLL